MYIQIICKTCGGEIGQECLIYRLFISEYIKKNLNGSQPLVYVGSGMWGELFDSLEIRFDCCRKTIMTHKTLADLIL
jgi:DNA-directed RNA polymerase subunit N (RpoN/RPB10)